MVNKRTRKGGSRLDFGSEVTVDAASKFPLILEPRQADFDPAAWASRHTAALRACIHQYGAILIRRAGAGGPDRFVSFAESICPVLHTEYGDLGDDDLTDKTYSSTPYPVELPINIHNESACNTRWPLLLFFYCHEAAHEGGASRLVDSRRVLGELPAELRRRLAKTPLTYTRNHYPYVDSSWQRVYGTDDHREVEQRCLEAGLRFAWKSDASLQTRCDRPAIVQHPVSNEDLLFHQLFLFHAAGLDAATRSSLEALYRESDFPRAVSFADGERVTDSEFLELYTLYEKHCVDIELQRGDILIIDNMMVAHGRAPFRGLRKMLVAMGDMIHAARPDADVVLRDAQQSSLQSGQQSGQQSEGIAALSQAMTRSSYPSVVKMFHERVMKIPDSVAIAQGEVSWSYGQTDAVARNVAGTISGQGILPGQTVAVVGESSFEAIAAILGVWMAGCTVLPMDLAAPVARRRSQLLAAGCRLILGAGAQPEGAEEIPFISLQDLAMPGHQGFVPHDPSPHDLGPDDPAYVFFTSGTTGTPKGIRGLHGSLSHFLCWQRDQFNVSTEDRFAQLTNLSFDVMLRDIFLPLISGATLCLPADLLERANPWAWFRRDRITALHVVPSVMSRWLALLAPPWAAIESLRIAFSAGEPLTDTLIRQFRERVSGSCTLINLYGPTETTLAKCWFAVPEDPQAGVQPLGAPLPETQVFVMDKMGMQCADGTTGEIVIRTPHRTAGYLGPDAPELAGFAQNPHRSDPSDLLFYTGDTGRVGADGLLHIAGRIDDQLKIFGVRVAPQEIAAVLLRYPGISQAHVMGEGRDIVRLTAFIVASEAEVPQDGLIAFLQDYLPVSMIPHRYIYLTAMPTTDRGKINRTALQALLHAPLEVLAPPGLDASPTGSAAQTGTEHELAALWSDLLGCDTPAPRDNFLFMGGHSLLAMQLVFRVRNRWKSEFTVQDVFENLQLREMAARIDQTAVGTPTGARERTTGQSSLRGAPTESRPVPQPDRNGRFPLSSSQRRLWFLSQLEPESGYYNIPGAIRFRGPMDLGILQTCMAQMLDRHEPLRTRFGADAGDPWQQVGKSASLTIRRLDLRHVAAALRHSECRKAASEDARKPFDLATPPLVRLLLIDMDEDDAVLVYTFNHLVADGWTNVIFVRELCLLYSAAIKGPGNTLPAPGLHYADYAVWEQLHSVDDFHAGLEYWKSALKDAPERLHIPTDRPRPVVQTHASEECTLTLDQELTRRLHQLCRDNEVTLFMAVLALLQVVLHHTSGERDMCIGTPVANRPSEELSNTFGCFINMLAIRSRMPVDCRFSQWLQIVRSGALGAFAHQEIPFDKVVASLCPVRNRGHHPLFQVMLNMLHWESVPLAIPRLQVQREWLVSPQTKFDMTLYVRQHDAVIDLHLVYNSTLFDAPRMENLLQDFHATLQHCLDSPTGFRIDSPAAIAFPATGEAPEHRDRSRLRRPGGSASRLPVTATEIELAEIWREILCVNEIALTDNFFELGGYSLLATRLVARIGERMRVVVPIWKLFEFPTVAAMAQFIDSRDAGPDSSVLPPQAPALLPAQQHLWKLHAQGKDGYHFNVPRAVRMAGTLQYDQLGKALNAVVDRHDVLRTCYGEEGGRIVTRILPATEVPIRIFDLTGFDDTGQRHREELACIQREAQYQFDLRNEIPLRVAILRLRADEHILLVTTHHIAADCWSMGLPFQALLDDDDPWHYGVFFSDLMNFYDQLAGTGAPVLSESNLRFADIFATRNQSASLQDFATALQFWKRYLQGASQVIHLPTDGTMRMENPWSGKRVPFAIDSSWHSRLQQFCQEHHTTHFVALFAAFARSIRDWAGAADFLVGVPVSNRGTPDSEQLIGHIANTIVLRARFVEKESMRKFIRRLHLEIHEALAYQYYPFEELVEQFAETTGSSSLPLFRIRFVLQDMPDASSRSSTLTLRPVQFDRGVSKYDLTVVIAAHGSKLRGWCEFKSPLFKQSTIDGFVRQFLDGLDRMLSCSEAQAPAQQGEEAVVLSKLGESS